MAQEVAIIEGQFRSLTVDRDPDAVLAEAQRAALALQRVIDQKPDKVMMGGRQYIEFDDWQTIGRFYGLFVREDGDPEYVEIAGTTGFKASACVLNREGDVVSRATAFCMRDEEKWNTRSSYDWMYIAKDGSLSLEDPGRDNIQWVDRTDGKAGKVPLKRRIKSADELVPLFQLASMAQTRACAKAFRNVLSWVAVLAGYSPTPAEELDGQTERVTQSTPELSQDDRDAAIAASENKGNYNRGQADESRPAEADQLAAIKTLSEKTGVNLTKQPIQADLTYGEAAKMIRQLQKTDAAA